MTWKFPSNCNIKWLNTIEFQCKEKKNVLKSQELTGIYQFVLLPLSFKGSDTILLTLHGFVSMKDLKWELYFIRKNTSLCFSYVHFKHFKPKIGFVR